MTRKQSARKFSYTRQLNSGQLNSGQLNSGQLNSGQLNSGQLEIDPSERKTALLALPLKTHIDMVTLTLDNLDAKLDAMREMRDEMGVEDVETLRHLSMRLMQQKMRIERMLGDVVLRVN